MTDNHNCGHVPVLGCLNELTSFCCFWFRGDDPSNLCCKCPKIMSTSCKPVGNKCFARDHLCLTLGASQHCPFPESNVSTVHFGKAIKRPRPTLSGPSSPLEPLELPEPSGQSGQPWHLIPRPTNSISQLISSQQLSSFPTAVRVKDTQSSLDSHLLPVLQIPEVFSRKHHLEPAGDRPSGFRFLVRQLVRIVTICARSPKRVENEIARKPASNGNVEVTETGSCCAQALNELGPHLWPKDLDSREDVDHSAGSRLRVVWCIGCIAGRRFALHRREEEMVVGVGEGELEGPDAVGEGVPGLDEEAVRILGRCKDEGGVVEQRRNPFPVPGRGQSVMQPSRESGRALTSSCR